MAQTLLGKYCHSTPFLSSVTPQSASHGWRGVMAEKEILVKVLGWIVGTGTKINGWSDP